MSVQMCDGCKEVGSLKNILDLKIEHIAENQIKFFEQKEKNEKWRAFILACIFGPLLAFNGWVQVQTKKEVAHLAENVIDYINFKADNQVAHAQMRDEINRIKDAINECRASHSREKFH